MVKIILFLRRKPELSAEDFDDWYLNTHVPWVVDLHRPHLARYVVNTAAHQRDLDGKPGRATTWDAVAELTYHDDAGFEAAFDEHNMSECRADTARHVIEIEHFISRETIAHREPLPTEEIQ